MNSSEMLKSPDFVEKLSDLYPQYDMLLCDIWGVLHDGVKAHKVACEALTTFKRLGGTVVLLSNAPRPEASVSTQIEGFGVLPSCYDSIVSSGDMTRHFLEKQRSSTHVFHIGPDRDRVLFSGTGITLVDANKAHICVCSGLKNDETEQPEDYRNALNILLERKIPMICANPDRMIERAGRFIVCAGAVAELFEQMGGAVTWFGKPYKPIYETALARLKRIKNAQIDPARVLAIGDSLTTDIAGALNAGIQSMLILGGIHRPQYVEDAQISMNKAREWLLSQRSQPHYMMAALV